MATIGGRLARMAQIEPDGSILHKIAEGIMIEPALDMGYTLATNVAAVSTFFDKLEGLLGPILAGMVITTGGEFAKISGGLKKTLAAKGVPPLLIAGFNALIDEGFEGIWAARRARRAAKDDPVTGQDIKAGFELAKDKVAKKAIAERTKFMTALKDVDPLKRSAFMTKVAGLDADTRAAFEQYRPLLVNEAWMVVELADADPGDWIKRLESVLGPMKPAKPVAETVVGAAQTALKAAGKVLDSIIPDAPAQGAPRPILDFLNSRIDDLSKGRHGT